MKNTKKTKKYYIGFLTNDKDPLISMSCYDDDHHKITSSCKLDKKEIANIFVDSKIKENYVHFFKVNETLFDFDKFGFKRNLQSEYSFSYSRNDLNRFISEIEMMKI